MSLSCCSPTPRAVRLITSIPCTSPTLGLSSNSQSELNRRLSSSSQSELNGQSAIFCPTSPTLPKPRAPTQSPMSSPTFAMVPKSKTHGQSPMFSPASCVAFTRCLFGLEKFAPHSPNGKPQPILLRTAALFVTRILNIFGTFPFGTLQLSSP